MSTILTSRNRLATRRCDGTCHNAKREKCSCICGGRYHGIGSEAAQARITEDWASGALVAHQETAGAPLRLTPTQLELPDTRVP